FVKNCTTCATRRNFPNPVAAKPIISSAFLNRIQVDLISMTSIPDASKRPIEVAIFLFDVFVCFCAPIILQSDNGREFTAEIIRELLTIWPDIHIINGHAMNIQMSRQTKSSPYALVFGQNPLRHFTILKEIKDRHINSEDELPENWFEPSEPQDDFDRQQLLERELENERFDELADNEALDDMINERLDEIVDDEVLDNMVDERLDEQLSKRINKQSNEKLSVRVTEQENAVINIFDEENVLNELSEDEVTNRSLSEDEVFYRSLPEDRTASRRLPENVSDIRPNKRHKPSVLTATTMGTNTQ
ncbi:13889_t:CDS:2, partial [Gigaspora rosea]